MEESSKSIRTRPMLPMAWVEKIFQRMHGTYGVRLLNAWKTGQVLDSGKDAGVQNAMETWAMDLGGFLDSPRCIAWALENLPADNIPSSKAFAEICRHAPEISLPALPYHQTEEDKIRQKALSRAATASTKAKGYDPLKWAKKPASQTAAAFLHDAWKRRDRYPVLAKIYDDLLDQGVVNEVGKLLKVPQ